MDVVVVSCSDGESEDTRCRQQKEGGVIVPNDRLYINGLHPVSHTAVYHNHIYQSIKL